MAEKKPDGILHRPTGKPADTAAPRVKAAFAKKAISDAVTEAENWLLDNGASPWDVAAGNLRGRVAWWTDDKGWVQEGTPGAELVVIVPVPERDVPPGPVAPAVAPAPDQVQGRGRP